MKSLVSFFTVLLLLIIKPLFGFMALSILPESFITNNTPSTHKCSPHFTGFNANARLFNSKLQEMIQSLSSEFSDAYFSLGKAYDLAYDAINNPSKYGLTNVTDTCCELATLLGRKLVQCKVRGKTCKNRDEYLFWDAAHPTEVGHGVLGEQCITNSTVCTPYSIQDLVQLPRTEPPTLLSDNLLRRK